MPWMGTVTFDETSYYNAADLTRENINIQYLRDELAANGYNITLSYPTFSVTRTDFPTVSRINNTRQNIIDLLNGFYYPPDAPAIAVIPDRKQKFDFNEANKIELTLQALYDAFQNLVKSYRACGTFYCGEEGLL